MNLANSALCFISILAIFYLGTVNISLADEEFVGPFSSWVDVKKDYGAIGDGKTDDTEALQKALNDLRPVDRKFHVLYLPSGTYRITKTIILLREQHSEAINVSIIGEDPKNTIILWDGESGGVMFDYGAWYAKVSRLTFDGKGKAKTAIAHGKKFVTYNEFSDIIIKDVEFGIEAGIYTEAGIAETSVIRCKFLRCSKAGISIQNFNSLDWFIWYSTFEDCRFGITNVFGAGNYNVYESLFRNSTEADMSIGHKGYFSFRNNTSINSQAFVIANFMSASSMLTIQGNTIIYPKDTPIQVRDNGPLLLFDNTILYHKSPAVKVNPVAGFVSAGNTFTINDPIEAKPNAIIIDDKIVYDKVKVEIPKMPDTPPNLNRNITELPKGSNTETIQQAINEASKNKGNHPVIHLPTGDYLIDKTITIPQNSDVQLVGDGVSTVLQWTGEAGKPLLDIIGQSHTTLRDFSINGTRKADGIIIQNCDQPGSRIFMNQINVSSAKQVGFLVDRMSNADISLHNMNHSDCGIGVKVIGANEKPKGRVVIFSGASSNNELCYDVENGGRLLARDIWYESGQYPRFMNSKGSGDFTWHGAISAVASKEGIYPFEFDDFHGNISFLNTILVGSDYAPAHFLLKGDGKDMNLLLLGPLFGMGENYVTNQSPNAKFALREGFTFTQGGGSKPIEDQGITDVDFIRKMIAQTRSERPGRIINLSDEKTDLRIYRVLVSQCQNCVILKPSQKQ